MKRMPTVIGFAVFLSQAPASAQEIPPHAEFRATPPEPKLLAGDVDSGCRKRRDRFPIEIDRRRGHGTTIAD
jgi:hypothetical protein